MKKYLKRERDEAHKYFIQACKRQRDVANKNVTKFTNILFTLEKISHLQSDLKHRIDVIDSQTI